MYNKIRLYARYYYKTGLNYGPAPLAHSSRNIVPSQ